MLDLARRPEPYQIAPPYGLSARVKPLTTAGMATAQAAVRRAVEATERQARERTEAGLCLDRLPDLSADGERDGFYHAQLIRELAVRHIATWTGLELEAGPGSPTPESIAAVMQCPLNACLPPFGRTCVISGSTQSGRGSARSAVRECGDREWIDGLRFVTLVAFATRSPSHEEGRGNRGLAAGAWPGAI